MRKLIWLVLAAALAWSVWWLVGSSALERGIADALDDMRESGWRIETEGIRTRGFPNRFDTTVSAPDITTPDGAVAWRAPFFQMLALSYRPNRVIAVFPDSQTLSGPFGEIDIASERARGSVTLSPDSTLALEHSQFVIDGLTVTRGGDTASMETLLFATRLPPDDDSGRTHEIGLSINDLRLPASTMPDDRVSRMVPLARLDATLSFDAPLDRQALEGTPPALTSLDLGEATIRWGEVELSAKGGIEIGRDGYPTGDIPVRVENWRALLRMLTALGLVPAEREGMIEGALEVFSRLSNTPERLSAPLSFRERGMFLGPLPLGPAPRFQIPS